MTGPQRRVVEYLAGAGHASSKATARAIYGSPGRRGVVVGILHRLEDAGLVEHYFVPSTRQSPGRHYRLTDAGRAEVSK